MHESTLRTERTNERMDTRTCERANVQTNEQMNERTYERTKERTNMLIFTIQYPLINSLRISIHMCVPLYCCVI